MRMHQIDHSGTAFGVHRFYLDDQFSVALCSTPAPCNCHVQCSLV